MPENYSFKGMARQLLPGVVLPGIIYFLLAPHIGTILALAAASSVPLLDSLIRLVERKPPSLVGVAFILVTGGSVALAWFFRSPEFILAKGAVLSGLFGLTFLASALVRRPLTKTIAVFLSGDGREARARTRHHWRHPKVLEVFCTLAAGWGLLLLISAAQQGALVMTVSPGMVVAVEAPSQAFFTLAGIVTSIMYVRRLQAVHPELRVLPVPGKRRSA